VIGGSGWPGRGTLGPIRLAHVTATLSGVTMADPTTVFFERLAERGRVPELARTTGRIRFDLHGDRRTDQWHVEIRRGGVTVSHAGGEADCVVHADAAVFDELVRGQANAMASILRGRIVADGDPAILIRFQRLFPAPTERRMTASARTVGKRRG
jgi:putative sterol carrier protein